MFYEENGIKRQLSALRTPEQNGVAERRNKSITEVARSMLAENDVSKTFWREVVNTIVYTMNIVQVRKDTNKTPYELWFAHSPVVKYLRIFGSKFYIKRDDDIGKFDARSDEGMFLGYSLERKAYRCYNQRTKTIMESTNVRIDEKFRIQERIVDYNSYDDVITKPRNDEVFLETNNYLQNEGEPRQEQSSKPSVEPRVEITTPTS